MNGKVKDKVDMPVREDKNRGGVQREQVNILA
jgi:hypothetical protein